MLLTRTGSTGQTGNSIKQYTSRFKFLIKPYVLLNLKNLLKPQTGQPS